MNNNVINKAIKHVCEKLCKLSKEEFDKLMKEHENGDIAKILLEVNFFDK